MDPLLSLSLNKKMCCTVDNKGLHPYHYFHCELNYSLFMQPNQALFRFLFQTFCNLFLQLLVFKKLLTTQNGQQKMAYLFPQTKSVFCLISTDHFK